jgi:hypothetical protein
VSSVLSLGDINDQTQTEPVTFGSTNCLQVKWRTLRVLAVVSSFVNSFYPFSDKRIRLQIKI